MKIIRVINLESLMENLFNKRKIVLFYIIEEIMVLCFL